MHLFYYSPTHRAAQPHRLSYPRDNLFAADKCSWMFGREYVVNNAHANVQMGGRHYLIQQNWVQVTDGGYCAMELTSAPSTTASPSPIPPRVPVTPSRTASPSPSFVIVSPQNNNFADRVPLVVDTQLLGSTAGANRQSGEPSVLTVRLSTAAALCSMHTTFLFLLFRVVLSFGVEHGVVLVDPAKLWFVPPR